jgi:hypothetical protein
MVEEYFEFSRDSVPERNRLREMKGWIWAAGPIILLHELKIYHKIIFPCQPWFNFDNTQNNAILLNKSSFDRILIGLAASQWNIVSLNGSFIEMIWQVISGLSAEFESSLILQNRQSPAAIGWDIRNHSRFENGTSGQISLFRCPAETLETNICPEMIVASRFHNEFLVRIRQQFLKSLRMGSIQ